MKKQDKSKEFEKFTKIAKESDYKINKFHGYYKFTREDRGNYVIYKRGNIKQMWGQFPSVLDDKDFEMKKATFEFGGEYIQRERS